MLVTCVEYFQYFPTNRMYSTSYWSDKFSTRKSWKDFADLHSLAIFKKYVVGHWSAVFRVFPSYYHTQIGDWI